MTFNINDPTPAIGTISPDHLQADGINRLLTTEATGFGTKPGVAFGDIDISCGPFTAADPGPPQETQISANCSVPSTDLHTMATVTVTSTGYGNRFRPLPSRGGGSVRGNALGFEAPRCWSEWNRSSMAVESVISKANIPHIPSPARVAN
jgi:hypothetical protein